MKYSTVRLRLDFLAPYSVGPGKIALRAHFASVTDPVRVGELLRAIHGYSGHPVTALASKLAPVVFVRPGSCGPRSGQSLTSQMRNGAFPELA